MTWVQDALAQWQETVFLELLEFDHPDLPDPIRLVNDTRDLVHDGQAYLRFPFEVQPHMRGDESLAECVITADAVDRRVVEALRGIADPLPSVEYKVVSVSLPRESWVLHGGEWNDRGIWWDDEFWNDGPGAVEQITTELVAGPINYEIKSFRVPDPATIQITGSFALDFLNHAFPKDYFAPWNSGTPT